MRKSQGWKLSATFLAPGCFFMAMLVDLPHSVCAMSTPVASTFPTCDDGLACTNNDQLQAGVCAGIPIGGVDIQVQLSPAMASGPVDRCISFEFYPDCSSEPINCPLTVPFGVPLMPGVGVVTVPLGSECLVTRVFAVTARDLLHTLRATGALSCNGTHLVVSFLDDPASGGNWLTGGNLDALKPGVSLSNANTINILDFAEFYRQFRAGVSFPDGDTDCAFTELHADINGDGLVDALDYAFIAANFVTQSQSVGCAAPVISPTPLTEISVAKLMAGGLGYLAIADLNHDGWLDQDDMTLLELRLRE